MELTCDEEMVWDGTDADVSEVSSGNEEVWTQVTTELVPWIFDVEPCGGVAELWADF